MSGDFAPVNKPVRRIFLHSAPLPACLESSPLGTAGSGERFCFRRSALESDSVSWQRGIDERREESQQPAVSQDLSQVVSPTQVVLAISIKPFFGGLSAQGQQAVEQQETEAEQEAHKADISHKSVGKGHEVDLPCKKRKAKR